MSTNIINAVWGPCPNSIALHSHLTSTCSQPCLTNFLPFCPKASPQVTTIDPCLIFRSLPVGPLLSQVPVEQVPVIPSSQVSQVPVIPSSQVPAMIPFSQVSVNQVPVIPFSQVTVDQVPAISFSHVTVDQVAVNQVPDTQDPVVPPASQRKAITHQDLEGFDVTNMSDKDLRRVRNTVSARRSRARRLGMCKEMEQRINELETEKTLLLKRIQILESSLPIEKVLWARYVYYIRNTN